MEKELLNTMFDNLLHIGNKTNYWNPRMKPYIYGAVNGIHIINLVKTAEKLEEVKATITELSKSGKKVLFVATKLQARDAFKKLAEETGSFYTINKWVPGLLTNFQTIKKRINTYTKLQKDFEAGALEGLTKKEIAMRKLELEKLDAAYGGLKEMKKAPDMIFVVDGVFEKQAVKEANTLKIQVISISNTNGDDLVVDNIIPANTNSVTGLQFIAQELKKSFSEKVVVEKAGTNEGKFKKIDDEKVAGMKKPQVKKDLGLKVQEDNKDEVKETKEDVVVEKEVSSEE
ncbi:30S ribosomal protein S2 [Candidatus Gracilibacteria bacterium]|nr:30S ribosomal protein S2 [Candidatus Gracilibacteria bacterium]NUJ98320.1 30S ribosomal protein S2 [Candidatus Gracilibacteria bacterium]NUJ99325.1 30S ribosomal protein S2 [Candidatus Gracilibacteria bacterium]